MIELDFKEPETFKTPDGEEYIINPLNVEDIKLLFKFMEYEEELKKLQKDGHKKNAQNLIYGSDEEDREPMVTLAEQIINKSIKNIETGEPLPKKYQTIKKLIQLSGYVAVATIDVNKEDIREGEDIPLEVKRMLSGVSKETSTPSKKKRGGRKKSS